MIRDGEPWVINGEVIRRAEITDFWAMVFNPSTVHRLVHVWLGCFILGAAFVMSISAWYVLKGKHGEFAKRSFTGALWLATISSLAMLVSGHFQAHMVYHEQPAKLAAFEAHFKTGPADMSIIGWPDTETETVKGNIAIPGGLSLLLFNDPDASVIGLDRFRKEDRPPIAISFFSYHIMIAIGVFFIGLTLLATILRLRNSLFQRRWLMWVFVFAVIPAFMANESGWVAAEVGRQPWIVYAPFQLDEGGDRTTNDAGQFIYVEQQGLRTSQAVSVVISTQQVFGSIVMFMAIYALLFVLWIYILHQKIKAGPDIVAEQVATDKPGGALGAAVSRVEHRESLTDAKEQG
jgi:cytochrome d ubiquinol oxidase subunit I